MKLNNEGVILLSNGIVIQAAKDYRKALEALMINPECTNALQKKDECERFFLSGWYGMLTDIDGSWLIKTMKMEVGYDS